MTQATPPRPPEAYSLFGEPLFASPIRLWLPSDPEEYRLKLEELQRERDRALLGHLADSDDPGKLIWFARKTEILGNFSEAVSAYSYGVRRWPEDPRFYRFRGHRFALLRRLDLAIGDLTRASELIRGKPDEVEVYASGGPSRDKMGFSSFHWNVWYHLGFSHFAAGSHEEAVKAYRRCMEACDTREAVIATTHWLYMPLIRLARWREAEKLLEGVEQGLSLTEVGDYYETLLMYKGLTSPEQVLEHARRDGGARFMTRGQAVANLFLARGEARRAVDIYREVLVSGEWTGGVHLIAEAELKRLGSPP